MPWSNQGGGGSGGGGGGPWGRGPGGGGGGGGTPPNFDDLIRKGQDRFRGMMPGGMGSARGIIIIVLVAIAVWLGTGFYRVQPDEEGVELIFGKWVASTKPGLNYNLPAPIGTVYRPQVTVIHRTEIGFRSRGVPGSGSANQEVSQESLMLTGDENIIDIQFVVFWKIDLRPREVVVNGKKKMVQDGVEKFLFNIRNPERTVKDAAESAMREIIGQSKFEYARTQGRAKISIEVQKLLQSILDEFGTGVEVTRIQIQKVDPPGNVLNAFRDVQAARADKERSVNEADAYRNEVVAKAQGSKAGIIASAEAYKRERTALAEGETSRFDAVYKEYKLQKEVTVRRIYIATMREVLGRMDKVLIETGKRGTGVVPYLPLSELRRRGGTATGTAGKGGGQ